MRPIISRPGSVLLRSRENQTNYSRVTRDEGGERIGELIRSDDQGAPHGVYDAILSRWVEIGVHGQADHLLGQPFAHRRAVGCDGKALVSLLAMQRDRVMDRGRNTAGLERSREPVAPARGNADGVLRPDRG